MTQQGLRGKIFSALTRSDADVSGSATGDLRGMLLAVGGSSARTRSGIDLTQAAHKLGVSRRTVERWYKTSQTGQGQRPSARHAKELTRKSRQAASTKTGRKAALGRAASVKAITSRGGRISLKGLQGPRAHGKEYMRFRTTELDLSPEQAQAMLDAWEAGGEKGFMDWAGRQWDADYLPDWKFEQLDSIDVRYQHGGGWR